MTDDRTSLSVLLVEDDANDERIMRGLLRRSKYFDCAVMCASDLASARHQANAGDFDVMILDYWVRAEDSLGLLTKAGQQAFHAPTVVVSSLDMTDVQAHSLTAGAMAYLHKNDLTASALDATLRTLLHSRLKEDRLRHSLVKNQQEQALLRENTADMAQEIITTLNAVHGFSESLTLENATTRIAQSYPALIRDGSERLIALLQRYMSQSGTKGIADELGYEQNCIIDAVEAAALTMERRCSAKQQEIDVVATTERLLADFDRAAVCQMIVNLISNAHTYSPLGCPIRVTVDDLGDSARISVIDQGVGMSEAQIAQVLQRHARVIAPAELAADGNGLGLAVVTSIVDMHGGTMEIESAKDWGTTVEIHLPKRKPTLN